MAGTFIRELVIQLLGISASENISINLHEGVGGLNDGWQMNAISKLRLSCCSWNVLFILALEPLSIIRNVLFRASRWKSHNQYRIF